MTRPTWGGVLLSLLTNPAQAEAPAHPFLEWETFIGVVGLEPLHDDALPCILQAAITLAQDDDRVVPRTPTKGEPGYNFGPWIHRQALEDALAACLEAQREAPESSVAPTEPPTGEEPQ